MEVVYHCWHTHGVRRDGGGLKTYIIGVRSDEDGERLTGDASETTGGNRDAPFFGGGKVDWITGICVLKLDLWGV